jgi:hypothetical protein
MDSERDLTQAYIDEVAGRALASLGGIDPNLRSFSDQVGKASGLARIDLVPGRTRLRLFKRLMLRLGRVFTGRQAAFNSATVAALQEVGEATAALGVALKAERSMLMGLRQEIGRIDTRLEEVGSVEEGLETLRRLVHQRAAGLEASFVARDLAIDEVNDEVRRRDDEVGKELQRQNEELIRLGLRIFDAGQE